MRQHQPIPHPHPHPPPHADIPAPRLHSPPPPQTAAPRSYPPHPPNLLAHAARTSNLRILEPSKNPTFCPESYTPTMLRRILAITLLLAFGFPLVAPAFAATPNSEASLPACCRSHGAHHCAMLHTDARRIQQPIPQRPALPLLPRAIHHPAHRLSVSDRIASPHHPTEPQPRPTPRNLASCRSHLPRHREPQARPSCLPRVNHSALAISPFSAASKPAPGLALHVAPIRTPARPHNPHYLRDRGATCPCHSTADSRLSRSCSVCSLPSAHVPPSSPNSRASSTTPSTAHSPPRTSPSPPPTPPSPPPPTPTPKAPSPSPTSRSATTPSPSPAPAFRHSAKPSPSTPTPHPPSTSCSTSAQSRSPSPSPPPTRPPPSTPSPPPPSSTAPTSPRPPAPTAPTPSPSSPTTSPAPT